MSNDMRSRLTASQLTPPKLIIFDLDNTLYAYDPCHEYALEVAVELFARQFDLTKQQVLEAYETARQAVKKQVGECASAHSRLLYFLRTFECLGFGPRPEEALKFEQIYWRTYLAKMELANGVNELFNSIRALKIPIALLTDLTAAIQIRKLGALGLSEAFEYVVTSEECNGEKKSGSSYRILLEKTGLDVGPHLWMVGDSSVDMMAKEHIGATTLLKTFSDPGTLIKKSDMYMESFQELSETIKRVFDE